MTTQEILENNKLIAEFMGGKYHKETTFPIHPNDIWLPTHGLIGYKTIELGKGRILLYHSSWNWLMPVVEKIESLNSPVYINSNSCTIYECINFSVEEGHWFTEQYGDTKLEATWLAITNFIKWYNKNKK